MGAGESAIHTAVIFPLIGKASSPDGSLHGPERRQSACRRTKKAFIGKQLRDHPAADIARRGYVEKVIIFGNGVFAEHIYYLLTYDTSHEVVGFTVDEKYIQDDRLFGLPVIPFESIDARFPPSEHRMTVAVSFQRVNRLREEKYEQAKTKGYGLINYCSPKATTYPNLVRGDNSIILENAIIGPFVRIGNNVIVASGAIIGHHTVLKDHCFISPGAVVLGGATIGEYCLIGANVTVKEEVTVARESLVGSGVTIARNTLEKGVYFSPPAELYPKRSDELRTWLTWPVRSRK
jgi:sugar O-acyltransferase (sialic acid O-acetyltransferase NeuD family)